MLRHLLFACCLLKGFYSISQQNPYDTFEYLTASGEVPPVLIKHYDGLYIDGGLYHQAKTRDLKNGNTSAWIHEVYNSRMLTYSDDVSRYISTVLQRLRLSDETLPSPAVFTFKSNKALIFSDGPEAIFVSTGLIAQLTNEAQLAFFLSRELAHIHNNDKRFLDPKGLTRTRTLEEKAVLLTSYAADAEARADREGATLYLKAGYNAEEMPRCFDILSFADESFEDIFVPNEYLSHGLLTIPDLIFDVRNKTGVDEGDAFGLKERDKKLTQRKEQLSAQTSGLSAAGSALFFEAESTFQHARTLARLETVRLQISEAQYNKALYSIFVMEHSLGKTRYLDRMKAHAWLGLVEQIHGKAARPVQPDMLQIQNEGQRFIRIVRRFNAHGKAAMALRIVTDLKNADTPDKREYEVIQERLMQLLSRSKLFDVRQFADYTFAEHQQKVKASSTGKYERIDAARAGANTTFSDSTQFYFFGISDLVKDDQTRAKLMHVDTINEKPVVRTDVTLFNPSLERYRKDGRKQDPDQFNATMDPKISELSDQTAIRLKIVGTAGKDGILTTAGYNEQLLCASLFHQLFYTTNYDHAILPIDNPALCRLKSNCGNSQVLIPLIQHRYHVKLRGYHFLGLMVVPLPFVLPEVVMGSWEGRFTGIYLDLDNGTINGLDHDFFRDPVNGQFIHNRLYTSLMNHKTIHQP